MKLTGKTVVILVADHYNDLEFWYPRIRLTEAGADVLVAGAAAGKTYASKYGMPATTDESYAEVDPDIVDALIIPGGYAPDIIRRDPAALDLVAKVHLAGKLVAHICHAGWVPISAGIMRGKTTTSFIGIKDDLINAGATWVDEPVVVDQNIISSRTPDDLPEFLRAIIGHLG